jgi:iron complex transport system permease protein
VTEVTKACELCGSDFHCESSGPGCWCETVSVGAPTLAKIRDVAPDCLCPECLGDLVDDDVDGASSPSEGRPRRVSAGWVAGSVAFVAVAFLVGLGTGPLAIAPWSIAKSAFQWVPFAHVHSGLTPVQSTIVWQLRAPRVVLAGLVGATLACAGSAYQGVFRNPLADPYLLGVAAGAGLGATIAIVYGAGHFGAVELLPLAAFAGAMIAVAAAYLLGRSVGGPRTAGALILAGVTVAAFLTAAQTFVQQQRTDSLREVYAWLLGGFTTADWRSVVLILPYCVVSAAIIVAHGRVLDVLSVGDEEAASLGLNVGRTRALLVVAATVATGAAVAVSGLIGFVGIIVPHTVRLLVSTSYRVIVVMSLLFGAGFLVLADAFARTVLAPSEVPIGVITAFCGAPFFAFVLYRTRTAV